MEQIKNGTSLNAQEHICTTDEFNNPTRTGNTRREMRLKNLWHRASYVIILFENDQFLIQKRTLLKDYCPGKLDPSPGGVVAFNEAYRDNIERELMEEMGIDVKNDKNSLKRLFTFKYANEIVKVWGDLWEFNYNSGSLDDLVLQETEVDEVLCLSREELLTRMKESPNDFMPDGLYALELYFQYKSDSKLKRRLIKGYSSSDVDDYTLRPKLKAIFFDCDDCLYFDNWVVANHLTNKIEEWCLNHGLRPGQAYELYKTYGTALKGLLAEEYLENNEGTIDRYLKDVHDIPIESLISNDEKLRQILLDIDPSIPKYIFTASVRHHAERCLAALGIADLFVDIIDVKACNLATKHSTEAFQAAMNIAKVGIAETCLLIDDSVKNINAAKEIGWRSVLVGRVGRDCGTTITSEFAEFEIDSIHDLPQIFPEFFNS